MPIYRGKNYYQYGNTGKKYYYVVGDDNSRNRAKKLAENQMKAIQANGGNFLDSIFSFVSSPLTGIAKALASSNLQKVKEMPPRH